MHSIAASTRARSRLAGGTTANGSARERVGANWPRARAHLSKNSRMSHARSRTTGILRSGAISSLPEPETLETCVRQVPRAPPGAGHPARAAHADAAGEAVGERRIDAALDPGDDVEHRLVVAPR